MTIKDLKIGEVALITKVDVSAPLRLRLLDMGFIPNTVVKVQKIAPLGNPIQIQIRGYEIAIRKEDAEKIYVKKENKSK